MGKLVTSILAPIGFVFLLSSPEVLLSVCQVLPGERACDLAHLRYSERLRAALRQPHSQTFLHFRAAARAAMASDHPWLRRVLRAPLSNCLILFRPRPSLIAACAIICARRLLLPGRQPWPRTSDAHLA
jgi:hypothetical protein